MQETTISSAHAGYDTSWRLTHLGRLMGEALRRFDERVLALMAGSVEVPLALSNLAARDQVGAAHIHITRHLAVGGSRLTDLAPSAGMSKQAMGDLVDQCEAWGLVRREADPHDRRARRVRVHRIRPGLAGGLPLRRGCRPKTSSARPWATTWRPWWRWGWRRMPCLERIRAFPRSAACRTLAILPARQQWLPTWRPKIRR